MLRNFYFKILILRYLSFVCIHSFRGYKFRDWIKDHFKHLAHKNPNKWMKKRFEVLTIWWAQISKNADQREQWDQFTTFVQDMCLIADYGYKLSWRMFAQQCRREGFGSINTITSFFRSKLGSTRESRDAIQSPLVLVRPIWKSVGLH